PCITLARSIARSLIPSSSRRTKRPPPGHAGLACNGKIPGPNTRTKTPFRPRAVRGMQSNRPLDLARTTLQLLALGTLIVSSFWIVRPFLMASIWAIMIAVATWPLLLRAQAWLGGRRSLAVAVMTIALLLVLLVPFYFGITTIVQNAQRIADWSKALATLTVPQPPGWVAGVPVVGS